ncbi:hypothetical protein AB685_21850 [Bacillus sp. LL01]|uniref:hypothetical protein n=1 Tax=Bacillus sp. LL01 TaxID=1665556 RepID=UPI00064D4043|nr:hypothetical protein [Bacillus sp. LL01]KMJ56436.1 hypothetical protein AB685_21850 [Bacillus sp. LL01]
MELLMIDINTEEKLSSVHLEQQELIFVLNSIVQHGFKSNGMRYDLKDRAVEKIVNKPGALTYVLYLQKCEVKP